MPRLLLFFLALFPALTNAQGQGDVWFFGDNVFMDFTGGAPVVSSPTNLSSFVSSSSLSDEQGNLILYTNGPDVRNRFHLNVPNWNTVISGYYSADRKAQGLLLLPLSDSLVFYSAILTAPAGSIGFDIYYSLLNPIARGDSGEVLSYHNFILDSTIESMSAVRHADGKSWWILAHEAESADFQKILVDEQGNITASKQTVGAVHTPMFDQYVSPLVFDQAGSRFVLTTKLGSFQVFNFDRCTGQIDLHAEVTKPSQIQYSLYGFSFSPSGRYLYASDRGAFQESKLYQYDLLQSNLANSEIVVAQTNTDSTAFMLHKLGEDGRIYIGYEDDRNYPTSVIRPPWLCVIENPDLPGASCNFVWNGFSIAPGTAIGMPNIPNYRIPPYMPFPAKAGPDTTLCAGGEGVQIGTPDSSGGRNVYRWFPALGLSDSTATMPFASPSQTTTYYLVATDTTLSADCGQSYDSVIVTVAEPEVLDAGPDQSACFDNEPVQIGPQGDGSGFSWYWTANVPDESIKMNGAPLQSWVSPFAETVYYLHSTDLSLPGCPERMDSVRVQVDPCPLEVSNVVTPNGDGINDYWTITDAPPGTAVRLFDRWGNTLLETNFYNNDWPANDSRIPEGVYFYLVKPPKGSALAGSLNLLR